MTVLHFMALRYMFQGPEFGLAFLLLYFLELRRDGKGLRYNPRSSASNFLIIY